MTKTEISELFEMLNRYSKEELIQGSAGMIVQLAIIASVGLTPEQKVALATMGGQGGVSFSDISDEMVRGSKGGLDQ